MDGQGNLERTLKVREKSGNLKINGYDSLQKIMYSINWGKDVLSQDSLRAALSYLRLLVKNLLSLFPL